MGAGQSASHESTPPKTALHVLRISPQSPAAHTSLEPYFDFVVGYTGISMADPGHAEVDVDQLERVVEAHEREGRALELVVWSSKTRQTRLVPITPSRAWSEPSHTPQSPTSARPSLLGLSMRICAPAHALDSVWHVLDVLEGSPGESAGLVPYGDWIVGWSGGPLRREQDFYDVIEMHEDKPLRVYVYSYDFDTLREVVLVPNRHWGGEGLLGCVFGFGLLHRIPERPTGGAAHNILVRASRSNPGSASDDGYEHADARSFGHADARGFEHADARSFEHSGGRHEHAGGRGYAHAHGDPHTHGYDDPRSADPHSVFAAQQAQPAVEGY